MKHILAIVFLLAACSTDQNSPEKFDNPCKPDPEAQECKDIQP